MFYWLIRRFGSREMVPECGDFRGITRPVLQAIRCFREPHKYYRGLFATMGFRQTVVLYDRDLRYAGDSKYPFRKLLALALDAILGFSTLPLRLVIIAACFMWGVSLLYLAGLIVEVFHVGRGRASGGPSWSRSRRPRHWFYPASRSWGLISVAFSSRDKIALSIMCAGRNVSLRDLTPAQKHVREC